MNQLGVRKGAWTNEEDLMLRNCIEKYGEGNWHQVPLRAGLNRCRKSCRLRWLNYLHPDIKRGAFAEDEIDLIIRLHKLLGNRWSLIAGRIPGRTANDIKNYWNSHLGKKLAVHEKKGNLKLKHVEVIRPLPHTFFKRSIHLSGLQASGSKHHQNRHDHQQQQQQLPPPLPSPPPQQQQQEKHAMQEPMVDHTMWLNNLLHNDQEILSEGFSNNSIIKDIEVMDKEKDWFVDGDQWDDLLDMNLWDYNY